ncbi:MAG TPA: D-Ala-D-Ala carboxypeptidase family metallohydrolase [Polyangiaceae bacterium]|nr:D-Ala-D-Ala carboxypeptidase family metallohydrolase [Polyangiaceae bacterium]
MNRADPARRVSVDRVARALALALAVGAAGTPSPSQARVPSSPRWLETEGWVDARQPLTETTWVAHYLLENRHVELDVSTATVVLEPYRRPWVAGLPEWGWFERGKYGARLRRLSRGLVWSDTACTPDPWWATEPDPLSSELEPARTFEGDAAFTLPLEWTLTRPESVRLSHAWLSVTVAPEPNALAITPTRACPAYKKPRNVLVLRPDGDHDRFPLLECDGSVSSDTLDRLSALMRPPGVARPPLPLPAAPETSERGEWVDGIKLAHPRLVWALERIAQAFPYKAIVIMSGYRRESHGYHPRGRAIDISVHGVDNAQLFDFCRTLNDVGCGYYPNNKFVHVDVREYGSKHPQWIDVALPGQPSVYVDEWPGLGAVDSAGIRH